MRREDLVSTFEKIEPSEDLKEKTKLKMFAMAVERDKKKKSPAFIAKFSSAICAAMVLVFCIVSVGLNKFLPHEYSAKFDDSVSVSAYSKEITPYAVSPSTQKSLNVTKEKFEVFLSALNNKYRAIGAEGTVISRDFFVFDDSSEYGIYGFAVLNIKISNLFFTDNEPFFGIKNGDTVSFIQYLNSDADIHSILSEGNELSVFAYSGKGMVPFDEISEKLNLKNAFVVFS